MQFVRSLTAAFVVPASIVLIMSGGSARAATAAPVVGTGVGVPPGQRDANWKIVAAPTDYTAPDSQTLPYSAYYFDGSVYNGFLGSTPALAGSSSNYISISPDGSTGFSDSTLRSWIFKQTFNVAQAGDYNFDFSIFADNYLQLFVGGSIDTTDQLNPTITGGTAIGGQFAYPSSLETRSITLNLGPGAYELYAVLGDYGAPTSFYLADNNSSNVNPSNVPAPLPLFGAGAAFGASRRLKRRIRLARTVSPHTAG